MNIEIKGNCSIEIMNLNTIESLSAVIKEYKLIDNELVGVTSLYGSYYDLDNIKKDLQKEVPFYITFNGDVRIINIEVNNLNYYEIVNQGLECTFDIVVNYYTVEDEQNEEENNGELVIEEVESKEESIADTKKECELEHKKDKIENDYDEILEDLLLPRKEIISDEDEKVKVSNIIKEDNRVDLRGIKDIYSNYRVYYIKNDEEVNKISNLENKSLDEIFRNNEEYEMKKKIIIK